MGLVLTTRHLHHYFLLYPIVMLIDYPLECIITHLEETERLIKWAIELSEYDIEY